MYKDDQSVLVVVPLTVIEPLVDDIVDPLTCTEWSPTGPAEMDTDPEPRARTVALCRSVLPPLFMVMFPLPPAEVSSVP